MINLVVWPTESREYPQYSVQSEMISYMTGVISLLDDPYNQGNRYSGDTGALNVAVQA